jgi:2-methylisocitrate lyase-like PEP mutase family enzyme
VTPGPPRSAGGSASEQAERARRFLELHHRPRILVLPNAWDAASARIFEEARFPAVATTSAGMAFSLGFPDGERVPFADVIGAVGRIVRAVGIPVSADLESGFGESPACVAESCREVIAAGAVGVNLEDGTGNPARPLDDPELHADRVRAVKEAAASAGAELVINARTDVYLAAVGAPEMRFPETVARCNAYLRAGADCVFVPGVTDRETIGRLTRDIEGPLNILAVPSAPTVGELESLGVARVSLGSGPMRATLGFLRGLAREVSGHGTWTRLAGEALPYAEANALFRAR